MVVCKTHLEPSTLDVQGKIFIGFFWQISPSCHPLVEREYCPLTRSVEEVALLQ